MVKKDFYPSLTIMASLPNRNKFYTSESIYVKITQENRPLVFMCS